MKINRFRRKITILIALVILAVIFCYFENNALVTSKYTYTTNKINSELNGYRIVQISDLHNKEFGRENEKLLNKVDAMHPDMIVLTGDLVDSSHTDISSALRFVKKAVKIAPTYYVTGNHEYALFQKEYQTLKKGLKAAGVIQLDNKAIKISDHFYLAGIRDQRFEDDGELSQYTDDFETASDQVIKEIPKNAFKVLLAHEPQWLDRYAKSEVDVVLSGHAHGGQIRIPLTKIGLVAPDQGLLPKYTAGIYKKNKTTMYVSRGLGNSILPQRIFNRPEVVMITLKYAKR